MDWLLTGGSGFTGRHLVKAIRKRYPNQKIMILDIKEPPFELQNNTSYMKINLLEETKIRNLLAEIQPKRVVHLAGLMRNENPFLMMKVNAVACGNLLEAVLASNISLDGFLVVGSVAQYGYASLANPPTEEKKCVPSSFYGYLKLLQEKIALEYYNQHSIPIICVRPANIVGPHMPSSFLIPHIMYQFKAYKRLSKGTMTLRLAHSKAIRDFIDVRDVSEAYISLFENIRTRGEIFNLGRNIPLSIHEIINHIKILLDINNVNIVEEKPREEVDTHMTNSYKIQSFIPWKPEIRFQTTLKDIYDALP